MSPLASKEEHKRFQRHVDTVLAFVEDRCVIDPEGRVTRSDVYFSYQAWCAENGRRPVAARGVYAKLLEQFPNVSPRDVTGGRGFAGRPRGRNEPREGGKEGAGEMNETTHPHNPQNPQMFLLLPSAKREIKRGGIRIRRTCGVLRVLWASPNFGHSAGAAQQTTRAVCLARTTACLLSPLRRPNRVSPSTDRMCRDHSAKE